MGIIVTQKFSFLEGSTPDRLMDELKLAEKIKTYLVECTIIESSDHSFYLYGVQEVYLSDFELEAPEKFFGLVRVNEKLFVNFALKTYNPQARMYEIQY